MKKSILAAVAICLLRCEMSGASTAILDFGYAGPAYLNDATIGWAFSPRADVFVTALGCEWLTLHSGLLPQAPDGVGVGIPVGLWNADGALLVSGFVHEDPTAGGWWVGSFRYESIAPTLLVADQVYRIGCSVPGNAVLFNFSGARHVAETVTDPLINLIGEAFIDYEGFTFPSRGGPDGVALIGPNFEFTIVPEPQTVTLLALGGIMLSVCRHTTRKRPERTH